MTDYRQLARQCALDAGTDADVFERQIDTESGFNPNAFNATSGATGIAQIIPSLHPTVDATDPAASLKYASRWMRQLLDMWGGSYARGLASYNWGPGNVQQWNGQRETLPTETQRYLDTILGQNWQAAGGPQLARSDQVRVTGTDGAGVRLRKEPNTDAAIIRALPEGATLIRLDRAWRLVQELSSGTQGWAADQFITPVDGQIYRVWNTDAAGLSLRDQPSIDRRVLDTLPEGTRVKALDRAWRLVEDPSDSVQAWAADQYLASA